MDASQKPGTISSPPHLEVATKEQLARLEEIASSSKILTLKNALGSTAALFIVGGTIRDIFLNKETIDLDLACNLSAQEMLEKLEKANLRVIPTGVKHGTVTCVVDGENIELTSFRAGHSGQHDTIKDDLSARDFTINAIAYELNTGLIDPYNGSADIAHHVLQAVGNAEDRFIEDPLRILRMIRFGDAQNRTIARDTETAAKKHVSKLEKVSVERIRAELEKTLLCDNPAAGISALLRIGALPFTWPELIPTVGFEQNRFHVYDVFEHTLDVVNRCIPDRIIRLAAVYHDIGKAHTLSVDAEGNRHFYDHEKISAEICKKSMERLRFSHDDIDAVCTIVRLHMRPFDCGPTGVRRIMRDSGDYFPKWRAFKDADEPGVFDFEVYYEQRKRFDELVEAEKNRNVGSVYGKLAVNGDDLIVIGFKPGKELGAVLKTLHEIVLENPEHNEKEYLLNEAKKYL